jgi:hypothetical protein
LERAARRRRRRCFGLLTLGLSALLLPAGAILSDAGSPWDAVGIAAIGYGIGLLVAGLFLLAGHNPLDR